MVVSLHSFAVFIGVDSPRPPQESYGRLLAQIREQFHAQTLRKHPSGSARSQYSREKNYSIVLIRIPLTCDRARLVRGKTTPFSEGAIEVRFLWHLRTEESQRRGFARRAAAVGAADGVGAAVGPEAGDAEPFRGRPGPACPPEHPRRTGGGGEGRVPGRRSVPGPSEQGPPSKTLYRRSGWVTGAPFSHTNASRLKQLF